MPLVERSAPKASNLHTIGRLSSAPRVRHARNPTARHMGTFTKNTHLHPGPCDSSPPRSTPSAEASGMVPLQKPIARILSLGVLKVVVRSERAAGAIKAAPKPWTKREPTKVSSLLEKPPMIEAPASRAVPHNKTLRLP